MEDVELVAVVELICERFIYRFLKILYRCEYKKQLSTNYLAGVNTHVFSVVKNRAPGVFLLRRRHCVLFFLLEFVSRFYFPFPHRYRVAEPKRSWLSEVAAGRARVQGFLVLRCFETLFFSVSILGTCEEE